MEITEKYNKGFEEDLNVLSGLAYNVRENLSRLVNQVEWLRYLDIIKITDNEIDRLQRVINDLGYIEYQADKQLSPFEA